MIQLDAKLLESIGLSELDDAAKRRILAKLYDALQLVVGRRLATGLSDSELEDFEEIIESGDDNLATQWLSIHRSDYRSVVRESLDYLLDELEATAQRARHARLDMLPFREVA